jgi:hypothetical protein
MNRTLILAIALMLGPAAVAQENERPEDRRERVAENSPHAEDQARFEKFAAAMSGVKLTGQFTIVGQKEQPLRKEEYEIQSVSKMPKGDYWLFQARIKYGQHDVAVPLPLQVKWAADTPVITLDEVTIPGLGTFGARVVIHDDKYAGTWSHGDVRGHLFGIIEKMDQK